MLLKKISVAAAGLALLASGPAMAANSAPTMLVSAAAVAQSTADDDVERSGFDRYIPIVVVVVFTAVFIYFLLDSQENDTVQPPAPNPGLPTSP
jgi:hypothetical protein